MSQRYISRREEHETAIARNIRNVKVGIGFLIVGAVSGLAAYSTWHEGADITAATNMPTITEQTESAATKSALHTLEFASEVAACGIASSIGSIVTVSAIKKLDILGA